MKEKEFMKKYGDIIEISTYYSIDDDGNVDIDEDSMQEEFDLKLKNILNVKDLTLGAYGIFVKGKIKYLNNEVDKK